MRISSDSLISIISALAAWYTRLVGWTSHLEISNDEQVWARFRDGKNMIFAFWHNRFSMMPFVYWQYFKMERIAVIVSESRDGELVARFLQSFRFKAIRGSSSRGGKRAMLNLMRSMREGWDVALTPDGPRGPRYRVQNGIIALASTTGAPLLPVSYASSLRIIFRGSWDHFRLPLPFSRIKLVFGDPILVKKGVRGEDREALQEELRRRLRQVDREAEDMVRG